MTRQPDPWPGSIIRGRDGRKGLVLEHERDTLVVHWEDEKIGHASLTQVTMLRPRMDGSTTEDTEPRERLLENAWHPGLIGLGILLAMVVATIYFLGTGELP